MFLGKRTSLKSIGKNAFYYSNGGTYSNGEPALLISLSFTGEYPVLEIIDKEAFFNGNADSVIAFNGLPSLKMIMERAFASFQGKLIFTGEYPALETIDEWAFSSASNAENIVAIACSSPAGLTIGENAFQSIEGIHFSADKRCVVPTISTSTATSITKTTTTTPTTTTTTPPTTTTMTKSLSAKQNMPTSGQSSTRGPSTAPTSDSSDNDNASNPDFASSKASSTGTIVGVLIGLVILNNIVWVVMWRRREFRNNNGGIGNIAGETVAMVQNPLHRARASAAAVTVNSQFEHAGSAASNPLLHRNGSAGSTAMNTAPANQPAAYDASQAGSSNAPVHEYAEIADVSPTATVAVPVINRDADGYVVDESVNRDANAPIEYAVPVDSDSDADGGVYVDDGVYTEGGGSSNRTGSANGPILYSVPMEEPDAEQPSDGYSAPLANYAIVPGSNV